MIHRWRDKYRFLYLAILLACAGCGNQKFPIAGEVTFDGQPVSEGVISLEPADGRGPTTGGKIIDGKYQLMSAASPLPGKKIVRISAGRKTGRKIRPPGIQAPEGNLIDEIDRYIPPMYNTQSTLTCDVSAQGPNRFDFHLLPAKTKEIGGAKP